MTLDLTKTSAYCDKTPYEVWQETEGVPIHKGLAIDDLTAADVRSWKRKGASGAFINMLGAGRSCDSYICEIPAQGQTLPERYLFEELIYVVKGRGATSVWTENGRSRPSNGNKAVCSRRRSTPGDSISTFNAMSRRGLSRLPTRR